MGTTSYSHAELRAMIWRDPNFSGNQRKNQKQELRYLYKYSVLKVKINLYWGQGEQLFL